MKEKKIYLNLVKLEKKIIDAPFFLLGIMIFSIFIPVLLMQYIKVNSYVVCDAVLMRDENNTFYVQVPCDSLKDVEKIIWYTERENNHYEAVIKEREGNSLNLLLENKDIYSEQLETSNHLYIVLYGESISLWQRIMNNLFESY